MLDSSEKSKSVLTGQEVRDDPVSAVAAQCANPKPENRLINPYSDTRTIVKGIIE